jgi:hypothetical protein
MGIEKALEVMPQSQGIFCEAEAVDPCLILFREKRFHFEMSREERNSSESLRGVRSENERGNS